MPSAPAHPVLDRFRDPKPVEQAHPPDGEQPFVIEHREALLYMLCLAAELEHGLMCEYLFAAFTLKQRVDEGVTEEQLRAIERWRRVVVGVAAQEMLHLSIVSNLLSALGMSPHLVRPNMPHPARHYPPGVTVALLPFGESALRHFMFLERPEGMEITDTEALEAVRDAVPHMDPDAIAPVLQTFATVGHLYRSIEAGLRHLVEKWGEARVFVGPERAQARSEHFQWPELVSVTNLATAVQAIETILGLPLTASSGGVALARRTDSRSSGLRATHPTQTRGCGRAARPHRRRRSVARSPGRPPRPAHQRASRIDRRPGSEKASEPRATARPLTRS